MDVCDVLIVGGGPAGSSCAWALRHSGLDVLILDRREFPRDKTCAGWVTPEVVEALQLDLNAYRAAELTLQPITGFVSGTIGGAEVAVTYDEIVSYGIRRCQFDHHLLARSGARTRLGEPLKQLQRSGDRWIVNDAIETRLLVGAGGHFCPVARHFGARHDPAASVVAAQEIEFAVDDDSLARGSVRAEVPELFFCRDLIGYGWCFRKENYLNIGLGRLDAKDLGGHVREFCDFLRERGKIACELPARFHGHAYQLYERVQPRLVNEGALLIGDAAGLAYPQSGEGIRPAVESGLIAARVIQEAQGRYAAESLAPYGERIRERFGPPAGGSVTDWLPNSWLRYLGAKLLASRWYAKSVVLDRWFLHRGVPALR